MRVNLSPESVCQLRECMRLVNYGSPEAVVEDAIGRLMEDIIIDSHDIEELRASLEESKRQLENGEGITLHGEGEPTAFIDGVIARDKAQLTERERDPKE